MRGGGNCLKYFKMEAEQKGGEGGTKILKRGGSWVKGWLP